MQARWNTINHCFWWNLVNVLIKQWLNDSMAQFENYKRELISSTLTFFQQVNSKNEKGTI